MDLNKDGTLSREEFNSTISSILDKDGDGLLSREDYEAGFDRLDFDGDGYISKDKFSRAVAPRFSFDALDADGDGETTAAEYRKGTDTIDQKRDGFNTELQFNSAAGAPARGTLPKQQTDTTNVSLTKQTKTFYVPPWRRKQLNQKPAADPSVISPESPVQETTTAELNINGCSVEHAKPSVTCGKRLARIF
jgi:hypothetical protein